MSISNVDINAPYQLRIQYLLSTWNHIAAIPESELQRLGVRRIQKENKQILDEFPKPLTDEQAKKIGGVLKTCAGYVFAFDREYLRAVLRREAYYDEETITQSIKRTSAFKAEEIPPIFQAEMEGTTAAPYNYRGVDVHSFPVIDFIINEFNPYFKSSRDLHIGSGNTPSKPRDVIYFAQNAFRDGSLDERLAIEMTYRVQNKEFRYSDEEAREFVKQSTYAALRFLEEQLRPLACKKAHPKILSSNIQTIEDIIGEKFWYTRYDTESIKYIIRQVIRYWDSSMQRMTMQEIERKFPIKIMRKLFPEINKWAAAHMTETRNQSREEYLVLKQRLNTLLDDQLLDPDLVCQIREKNKPKYEKLLINTIKKRIKKMPSSQKETFLQKLNELDLLE